jgi:hypothetical protein
VKPRDRDNVTDEVGDEGGSPGNLEERRSEIGTGSEAGELWRPAQERKEDVPRDQVPPGRRTP